MGDNEYTLESPKGALATEAVLGELPDWLAEVREPNDTGPLQDIEEERTSPYSVPEEIEALLGGENVTNQDAFAAYNLATERLVSVDPSTGVDPEEFYAEVGGLLQYGGILAYALSWKDPTERKMAGSVRRSAAQLVDHAGTVLASRRDFLFALATSVPEFFALHSRHVPSRPVARAGFQARIGITFAALIAGEPPLEPTDGLVRAIDHFATAHDPLRHDLAFLRWAVDSSREPSALSDISKARLDRIATIRNPSQRARELNRCIDTLAIAQAISNAANWDATHIATVEVVTPLLQTFQLSDDQKSRIAEILQNYRFSASGQTIYRRSEHVDPTAVDATVTDLIAGIQDVADLKWNGKKAEIEIVLSRLRKIIKRSPTQEHEYLVLQCLFMAPEPKNITALVASFTEQITRLEKLPDEQLEPQLYRFFETIRIALLISYPHIRPIIYRMFPSLNEHLGQRPYHGMTVGEYIRPILNALNGGSNGGR